MQGVVRRVKRNRADRVGSRGALLIEILIGLAVLGIISVVFIGALYTSLHAARIADERATAFTLAKSQMEFVKARKYLASEWELGTYYIEWKYEVRTEAEGGASAGVGEEPGWWSNIQPEALDNEFLTYWVEVTGTRVDLNEDDNPDTGIRLIKATAYHNDDPIFTLRNYEINR